MREFIRHPFGFPIAHQFVNAADSGARIEVTNLSEGGLCFLSPTYIAQGQTIEIEIPIGEEPFKSKCLVTWCAISGDGFDVGVKFDDSSTEFALRLVEQACYINEYRKEVEEKENRKLTPDEAAKEWVEKYADSFPD